MRRNRHSPRKNWPNSQPVDQREQIINRVLSCFPDLTGADIVPTGRGLINQTYLVSRGDTRLVLQRISPIFDPRIHLNIEAVTQRLEASGIQTPRLIRTHQGALWADLEKEGVWRLQTYIPGVSFDRASGPAQILSASRLVGQFHRVLCGLEHEFVGLREGVHDTAKHLGNLRTALVQHSDHTLFPAITALANAIFSHAESLASLPNMPPVLGHGDLKLNNILFAGENPPQSESALAIIDLDTVGPQSLAFELGDAWRSWCNQTGEDDPVARIDLDTFAASLAGYSEGYGRAFSIEERQALLLGPEWVSLELASRFAADALNECYFGWDRTRYPTRGAHNQVRAQGQFALHRAFCENRPVRAKLLGL